MGRSWYSRPLICWGAHRSRSNTSPSWTWKDLGLSGSSTDKRSGFARLTSQVALAHVGIVLGLEVSRLARNNADWYRLLELCGITDTLIGDNDGVYHPALFNDRLLLGLNRPDSQSTYCLTFPWLLPSGNALVAEPGCP